MSGLITVCIRKQDGNIDTYAARSRFLLEPFTTEAFRNGDINPLVEHLSKDAEVVGDLRPTKWPIEDGIVFVDDIEKTVLNWQCYSPVSAVHAGEIGGGFPKPGQAELDRRARLASAIVEARRFTPAGWVADPDFKRPANEAELIAQMERLAWGGRMSAAVTNGVPNMVLYVLDFPAWNVRELQHNAAADLEIVRAAINAAYPLTEDEKLNWDLYFDDAFDGLEGEEVDQPPPSIKGPGF
jgi:hypothetical protein